MLDFSRQNIMAWSRQSSRHMFGEAMLEAAEYDEKLMVITADVASSANLRTFAERYPEKFLNVGLSEQCMLCVAAGMAKEGFHVFISSFAPFVSMRIFEGLRSYLGYMHLNVTVVGLGSGFGLGTNGNTHYGLEDMAITRTIPGMTVLSPSDNTEVIKSLFAALAYEGPVYLRLTGVTGSQTVYKENYDFDIGKSIKLSEGSDVCIFATGSMVHECTRAVRALSKNGISAGVTNIHTIKPLDTDAINEAGGVKLIVTVEEHSVIGGLGSAVAEYLAERDGMPKLLRIGIPDIFPLAGTYRYTLDQCGLSAASIADRIKQELN